VGQALVYTQDTWHSMARRGGHNPDDAASTTLPDVVFNGSVSLPIVTLAAIKKSKAVKAAQKRRDEDGSGRLCCLEASLQIPKELGEPFRYTLHRYRIVFTSNRCFREDDAYWFEVCDQYPKN
jgi:hypothetical protein